MTYPESAFPSNDNTVGITPGCMILMMIDVVIQRCPVPTYERHRRDAMRWLNVSSLKMTVRDCDIILPRVFKLYSCVCFYFEKFHRRFTLYLRIFQVFDYGQH